MSVELLAAIPSIVYGLWGLAVLVPIMQVHVQPMLGATLGRLPGIGWLFDNTANTATVTTDTIKNVVLPGKPTGSGYWYSDGRHGLRGKGKEAMWEVGRMVPIKCMQD